MTAIENNRAAWQKAALDKQFVVGPGPDQTKPADDELIIKVAYVAINPSEWKVPHQEHNSTKLLLREDEKQWQ